ncbi:MAG: serine/threonine-protein kinase [Lachnospiraceae bacterium]|nr:serine/threonine-protein kinase [Lachnospiraceae bacterium]
MEDQKHVIGGRYRLLRLLDSGGGGRVFLAEDLVLGKKWAVKVLPSRNAASIDEINMLKNLSHPRLPRIVDVLEDGRYLCVVMDYVEGKTLEQIRKEKGPISEKTVLRWGIQMAGVLTYLHERKPQVIYRDLKPENMILRPDGEVMLLDLGAAVCRSRQSAELQPGTPGYAAPEQYGESGKTDVRSDLYSLGMTLTALLSGKRPAEEGGTDLPAGISRDTVEALRICTDRRPSLRYQTAADFRDVLQHCLEEKRAGLVVQRKNGAAALVLLSLGLFFLLAGRSVRETILAGLSSEYANLLEEAGREEEEEAESCYLKAMELLPNREEAYLQYLSYMEKNGDLFHALSTVCTRVQKTAGAEVNRRIADLYFAGSEGRLSPDYRKAAVYYGLLHPEKDEEIRALYETAKLLGEQKNGDDRWDTVQEALAVVVYLGRTEQDRNKGIQIRILAASAWRSNQQAFAAAGIDACSKAAEILEELIAETGGKPEGYAEKPNPEKESVMKGILKNLAAVCCADARAACYNPRRAAELYREAALLAAGEERKTLYYRGTYAAADGNDADFAETCFQELISEYMEAEAVLSYSIWLLDEGRIRDAAAEFRTASSMEGAEQDSRYEILKRRLDGLGI